MSEHLTGTAKELADAFEPLADVSIYKDEGEAVKTLINEIEDHRVLEQHHWFSLFNP